MHLLPPSGGPETPLDGLLPLFAYGTLLDETFVAAMLERPVSAEPARLHGYRLVELPRLGYPTLVRAAGKDAEGRLYRDLTEEDFRRLDAYEGVLEGLYQRRAVEIEAAGERQRAFVYLATDKTFRRYG